MTGLQVRCLLSCGASFPPCSDELLNTAKASESLHLLLANHDPM
jgi:hypothetical protein